MTDIPANPFERRRLLGRVIEVRDGSLKVHLPRAAQPNRGFTYGTEMRGGEVGEMVFVEVGSAAVFGRIARVYLPESYTGDLEDQFEGTKTQRVFAHIDLLATLNLVTGDTGVGVAQYPRIGSNIYSAAPEHIAYVLRTVRSKHLANDSARQLTLGHIQAETSLAVEVHAGELFSRHAAIVGNTGGGKSWTTARLVEQLAATDVKTILVDPTGEYHSVLKEQKHFLIGSDDGDDSGGKVVDIPYRSLKRDDLFAMFTPAARTQLPILRQAIASLKLVEIIRKNETSTPAGFHENNGILWKANKIKKTVHQLQRKYVSEIGTPNLDFDADKLAQQIRHECVYETDRKKDGHWGGFNEQQLGYCTSLHLRIADCIKSESFRCIFSPEKNRPSLFNELSSFLDSDENNFARISLRNVGFSHNVREIIVNAIARFLLDNARQNKFRNNPVIFIVDEAHNFLSVAPGDEFATFPLDSTELIAREGRKYGIYLGLVTQRPRDLPRPIFSQIGSFIAHRLTNEQDRNSLAFACSEMTANSLHQLPVLDRGEALILGPAFPIPVPIQISRPHSAPDSSDPLADARPDLQRDSKH